MGLNMGYFWKSILSLSKGMVIPALVGVFIMKSMTFNRLLPYFLMIAAYTAVYCGSMWLFGMNGEEKQLVLKPVRALAAKMKRN
jgi:hypothetical protein